MTIEQEKQVEEIQKAKEWIEKWDGERDDHSVHNMDPDDVAGIAEGLLNTNRNLLAIVDDLRKRLPEKLNGGEIMAECFRAYEVKHEYESFASGWLAAFRMMGAIKE